MSVSSRNPYSCPNKQHARETIWQTLAAFKPPPRSRALLLPGPTRYELDVVLAQRFATENIWLVEKRPAIQANFTRRARTSVVPPKDHILRMLVSDAASHLVERRIAIDVAHLDFCTNCTREEMINETKSFIRALADDSLLAITWLRGREHQFYELQIRGLGFGILYADPRCAAATTFSQFSSADRGRFQRVHEALRPWETSGATVTIRQVGHYQNTITHNPMFWVIYHIIKGVASQPTPISEPRRVEYRSGTRRWSYREIV